MVTPDNLVNQKYLFLMLHRLILKFRKFQLPTPKRLSTVVKNIWGNHPPMSNRVKVGKLFSKDLSTPPPKKNGKDIKNGVSLMKRVLSRKSLFSSLKEECFPP